jgi:hypothetical protein
VWPVCCRCRFLDRCSAVLCQPHGVQRCQRSCVSASRGAGLQLAQSEPAHRGMLWHARGGQYSWVSFSWWQEHQRHGPAQPPDTGRLRLCGPCFPYHRLLKVCRSSELQLARQTPVRKPIGAHNALARRRVVHDEHLPRTLRWQVVPGQVRRRTRASRARRAQAFDRSRFEARAHVAGANPEMRPPAPAPHALIAQTPPSAGMRTIRTSSTPSRPSTQAAAPPTGRSTMAPPALTSTPTTCLARTTWA